MKRKALTLKALPKPSKKPTTGKIKPSKKITSRKVSKKHESEQPLIKEETRLVTFTNPWDHAFLKWVETAAKLAGLTKHEIQVIAVDRNWLSGRLYGSLIDQVQVCIIDVSYKGYINLGYKLGALRTQLNYFLPKNSTSPYGSPLDRRIILVTRTTAEEQLLEKHLGRTFSTISISDGINNVNAKALGKWIVETIACVTPKVFISYKSSRRLFSKSVAEFLTAHGADVWLDDWKILPGDSIPEEINRGLSWCTHLVLIVDSTFSNSKWVKAEVESVLFRQLTGPRMNPDYDESLDRLRPIIPLFLIDPRKSPLPPLLTRIRGIDCRKKSEFEDNMRQLWMAMTTVQR